jgi:hypothetical protein
MNILKGIWEGRGVDDAAISGGCEPRDFCCIRFNDVQKEVIPGAFSLFPLKLSLFW